MEVGRHQAIPEDFHGMEACGFREGVQESLVIPRFEEELSPVVPAIYDVDGQMDGQDASGAWHGPQGGKRRALDSRKRGQALFRARQVGAYNAPMIWIMLAAIGLAVVVVVVYNGIVRLALLADNAWSDIDVQLKRRHDLIPNIVEAVKGYAGHERGTLDAVVAARSRAMSAQGPAARGEAEGALALALRGLFALVESYPQLRAAESFAHLQTTLVQIEDAIQHARRYYNAVVRDLNTRVQQFPSNLVAMAFRFTTREFFQLRDAAEAEAPQVRFGGG
jgi:LemA protein